MKEKTKFKIGMALVSVLTPTALFWLVGAYQRPDLRSVVVASHAMILVFGLLMTVMVHFKELP